MKYTIPNTKYTIPNMKYTIHQLSQICTKSKLTSPQAVKRMHPRQEEKTRKMRSGITAAVNISFTLVIIWIFVIIVMILISFTLVKISMIKIIILTIVRLSMDPRCGNLKAASGLFLSNSSKPSSSSSSPNTFDPNNDYDYVANITSSQADPLTHSLTWVGAWRCYCINKQNMIMIMIMMHQQTNTDHDYDYDAPTNKT